MSYVDQSLTYAYKYTVSHITRYLFQCYRAMPTRWVAAGCSTAIVHGVIAYMNFLETRRYMQNGHKLLSVIEVNGMVPWQAQCYVLSIFSKIACFIVEGVCYSEDMGIPTKKQL